MASPVSGADAANAPNATADARRAFRDDLLRRRLLVATGVAGVYGRALEFEDTVERVDRLVTRWGEPDRPEIMRFPPVLNRSDFERSGYLESFPHLTGSVHTFAGDDDTHRKMLRARIEGSDWTSTFVPAAVVLVPAACYPVYPMLSGTLPQGGRLVDVMSYCFRHEPSDDIARMQMFRMHEQVRLGEEKSVWAWRERWVSRAAALAAVLGLDVRAAAASDPFFGRGGKLLAANQRDERRKVELLAPIGSADEPTAIISINYHQDHFSRAFAIRTADGADAQTACVGFGLERIALALYRRHGFDRHVWPASVRQELRL